MINLVPSLKYIEWHENAKHFNQPGGVEHYKMLAYLAMQMPKGSTVVDLGTYLGCSAIALAYNEDVTVETYDIVDLIPKDKVTVNSLPNVKRVIKDCKQCVETFKDKNIIVLDIDPHDGVQEKQVIKSLMDVGYKGIVICDDININEGMRDFWSWVPLKKTDVTKYGHWTGTGIITFDVDTIDVIVD